MMTGDGRCTREIKPKIVIPKAAFNRKKSVLAIKLHFDIRREPLKGHIWNVAFCGAETWTLREADKK